MNETVRTFIAIELAPSLRAELKRVQGEFKHLDLDVKWVNPENIHLTLKFLGHITIEQVESVKKSLPEALKGFYSFEAIVNSLGAFPSLERPKIIWAGIEDGKEEIGKIAREVENAMALLDFEKESRPFSSHITIGRVRSSKNQHRLAKALKETNLPAPLKQPVNHVTLFKSTLTPHGPIYESLQTYAFA